MRLRSEDFEEGGAIPPEFTCDGEGVSPRLSWEDVPPGTGSFALSVTDPDAPGGTFIHWLVYNIPGGVRRLDRGRLPAGAVEVENDFGRARYGGPCPPSGTHRYFFTLYALKTGRLEGVTKRSFFSKVKEQTLQKAELMGRYRRR